LLRKIWAYLNFFIIIINSILILTQNNFTANKNINIFLIILSIIGGLSILLLEYIFQPTKKYNIEDYIYIGGQMFLIICSLFSIYSNSLDPFFGIILFSMGDTTFRNFSFFKYGVYALLLVLFIRTIVQGSTLFSAVQVMIIPFIIAIMTIHTSKKRELSFKRNFLDFKVNLKIIIMLLLLSLLLLLLLLLFCYYYYYYYYYNQLN